jgi:hypothetical protein
MPQIRCGQCATTWPQAYQFCGRCGGPLHAAGQAPSLAVRDIPPPPYGPAPTEPLPMARIQLVVLRGSVPEGSVYDLPPGLTTLGTQGELAIPGDPLLDPKHATLDRSPETLDLVGIPGSSGVFRRLREPGLIRSGDVVFVGEQYLLVRRGDDAPAEPLPAGRPLPPETFGTPLAPLRLHVTQLLAGGLPGRVVSTEKDMLTVGREGSDLSFPQDRYMSGRHVRFELAASGHIQVIDLGSLNGTFIRVEQVPTRLFKGDEVQLGTMLFRVEIGS